MYCELSLGPPIAGESFTWRKMTFMFLGLRTSTMLKPPAGDTWEVAIPVAAMAGIGKSIDHLVS